ncbi:clarin-2 [Bacillus rossius redtenbacheri]|uniref:clarin-2 n=1 Tax=Bacillus rossius redtenbacheri TaxID=93214 RepID=UPI002FDCE1DD
MNFFKRGMIFVTFFGSCLVLGLIVAALGTKFWVVARAKRVSNPDESDGRINFGLFQGRKDLNVAYGWRTYPIDMLELMRTDRELLVHGLWVGTVGCLAASLLFVTLAAVFAVINTATTPAGALAGAPGLFVWNCAALVLNVTAVALWGVQFFQKLQHNVMSQEDRDNQWYSEHMASLGYSFWFVVAAVVMLTVNIVVLYVGVARTREKKSPEPMLEEKTNGAIMLY